MKTTHHSFQLLTVMACALVLLPGCAAKKGTLADKGPDYRLEYRMQKGQPMQYDLVSEFVSTMEVMGQKINVESDSRNLFTLTPAGLNQGNYRFNVKIDTAYIHIESPRGRMEPDMSAVVGAGFIFELSSKGQEVDCSGAKDLKYSMGEYEELSLFSDFKTFFPDLPAEGIKPGGTWSNQDTLVEEGSSGFLEFITTNDHRVEAVEPFDGHDCLRIRTTYSGSMQGEGDMQGAKTRTEGTIAGEYTWYFAYKKGVLLRISNEGRAESTTVATGHGNEITIPGTRDFRSTASLVMN